MTRLLKIIGYDPTSYIDPKKLKEKRNQSLYKRRMTETGGTKVNSNDIRP